MTLKAVFSGIVADIKLYRNAYILTFFAAFAGMLFGWDTGLISGVLIMPAFQRSFNLDPKSKNFSNVQGDIVSILQGGAFFGAASSFYISDRLGRKLALIIAAIIFLVGSIIQTCSALNTASLSLLYFSRFVGGFGVGLAVAVAPTYIGENANKEVRGRCGGSMQLFNVTGLMLSYFVNLGMNKSYPGFNDLQWRIPFALQMIPGVILLFGILFQNESPRWLVEKDRVDDARAALSHARGKPEQDSTVEHELQEIINDFRGRKKLSFIQQLKAVCESKKIFYRCSLPMIVLFWQQWSGVNSVNYYSPQVFASIGLHGTSANLFATGIYGVVKVVFTALGILLAMEQIGRKWLLIIGAAGQAFAVYYIGIQAAVAGPTAESGGLSGSAVFAIVCVYLFAVFYAFGWGPIAFPLAAECAPNHVRSLIMALALMVQWLINFNISKITPIMLAKITYGTFLVFGTSCVLACLYAVFCIPETKNVPLESIYLLFEGDIIKGCINDVVPKESRARKLKTHSHNIQHVITPDNDGGSQVVGKIELDQV